MARKYEIVPLSDLKPWAENPRINDAAVPKLMKLIEEHGFAGVIVATPDGVIRAGHTRFKAVINLGWTEIPVEWKNFPSREAAEEYALADNKSAEWAEWDHAALGKLFKQRREVSVENLQTRTGFAQNQIEFVRSTFGEVRVGGIEGDPSKRSWRGMPEFQQDDLESWHAIKVHFDNPADMEKFSKLIGQKLTENTRSIWYPPAKIERYSDRAYVSISPVNPKYPIYIISKGRWESRHTSRSLEKLRVPYRIIVEPQEYASYAAVIDPKKILKLPFSNRRQGSIPARNWVWEHSISEGAKYHWILDDNIDGFFRLHKNLKTPVGDGTIFRAAEDFVDRYENIGEAGFNYFMFATRKSAAIKPITFNTRIYSCILLRNDLPFRWRGTYNEDTDLSLRILKSGLCTVLFNVFLARKKTTMSVGGGNNTELYRNNGRLWMAQSLQEQHPDVVKITSKWGRPQHQVDYSGFKDNALILKTGIRPLEEADNYGMSLQVYTDGKSGGTSSPHKIPKRATPQSLSIFSEKRCNLTGPYGAAPL